MNAKKEWIKRSDDIEGLPFVVVYLDRSVWPASDYFATRADAEESMGSRDSQNLQERRFVKGRGCESRILWGTHPSYSGVR